MARKKQGAPNAQKELPKHEEKTGHIVAEVMVVEGEGGPESEGQPETESEVQPETEPETEAQLEPQPLTLELLHEELQSLKLTIQELQTTLTKRRKPVTSNGKIKIRDKKTGIVYPSKNNVYQSLLKAGELKELVDKGVFGDLPEKNTFGCYALLREWPDRFEQVKDDQPGQ